ncbi:MAG: hypothetical protein ACTS5I_16745, partial [Rhodanobacter sp.]
MAITKFTSDRNGNATRMEKLNVVTAQSKFIGAAPATSATSLADHTNQIRAIWARDGFTETRLWTRRDNGDAWTLRNDSAKSGVGIVPLGFNRDNSRLYVRVSHGDQPDAIELMNPNDGTHSMVYQGKFADPSQLIPSADGLDYYAIVTADGKPTLHYLDENSGEAQ